MLGKGVVVVVVVVPPPVMRMSHRPYGDWASDIMVALSEE